MPETVTLFRILLAAPSDVTEEHSVIEGLVRDWNVQHGETQRVRIEVVNWRTHSYPAAGRRPQALINRQFADRADIVIAIFWRKFGSPTGKASSGTVEEIQRALRRRKKVMVCFRRAASADPQERAKIERFKRQFGRGALYGNYADLKQLETSLRKDIAFIMNEETAPKPAVKP